MWEFYEDQDDPCASCNYGNNGRCGSYNECDLYQNYHDAYDDYTRIARDLAIDLQSVMRDGWVSVIESALKKARAEWEAGK